MIVSVRKFAPSLILSRILEEPELVSAVQALPPKTLQKLINHVGLEDAGEIVALATTEQLAEVFDEDLWMNNRPGEDEAFDSDRFGLWLEIMLEMGEDTVAKKLTELDEDFVTLGLYAHILVINLDELFREMRGNSDELEMTEKAFESCLYEEFDDYQVISRRHERWDAVLSTLLALDKNYHDYLQRLLDRCCYMGAEYIEENGGLYEVLTSAEMLESDLAADREDRRARRGFVAPSAALSFLKLAHQTKFEDLVKSRKRDPLTSAYFRELERTSARSTRRADAPLHREETNREREQAMSNVARLLKDAGIVREEPRPVPLLGGTLFDRAILGLAEQDQQLYAQRMEELAYLANVLVAGCGLRGRRFRPVEAAKTVMTICDIGLEHLVSRGSEATPRDRRASRILTEEGADKLFQVGWNIIEKQGLIANPESKNIEFIATEEQLNELRSKPKPA